MMKIVVLDGYAGNPGDLSWHDLEALGQVTVYDRTAVGDVLERCRDAQVVLTNKVVLDGTIIAALPQLKYIGVLATGYNVVDVQAARSHGIVVTNVPAYSTESVAQMTFAHLLNIVDRCQHYTAEARNGKWSSCADFSYTNTPVIELNGKLMGIVGLGHIGSRVAQIAHAFDMRVQALTSKAQEQLPDFVTKVDIDTLFATSDVVTLHCPLTPQTRNLVNRSRLHSMKASAILINTARGPLINEADLADCLEKGGIMAAGLDVMVDEPPHADNRLLRTRNCYFTPHIAWASKEARERLMQVSVANVKAFIDGHPVNVVN